MTRLVRAACLFGAAIGAISVVLAVLIGSSLLLGPNGTCAVTIVGGLIGTAIGCWAIAGEDWQ